MSILQQYVARFHGETDQASEHKCEIRYNEDGTIDEIVVSHGDKNVIHIEDMGGSLFIRVSDTAFDAYVNGKRSVALRMAWSDNKLIGHRPKGV